MFWLLFCYGYRDLKTVKERNDKFPRKEVIGITESGETRTLAKFLGAEWSLMDSQWSAQLPKNTNIEGHFFELMGHRMVSIFCYFHVSDNYIHLHYFAILVHHSTFKRQ